MAIVDILKFDGAKDELVWKHPNTEFNNKAQLIVNESQQAIFINDGAILSVFGPGKHQLETSNLPFAKSLIKLGTGGRILYNTELYFVSLTEQMAIKWGTNSKISYLDPEYGFPVEIGACGQMSYVVDNPAKLLVKVVGTEKKLTTSQLTDYIRSFFMNRIKSSIPAFIQKERINIFQIDQYLDALSEECKTPIKNDLSAYGIELRSFLITTIMKPDEDQNFIRFKDIHYRKYTDVAEARLKQQVDVIEQETKAKQTVIEAEAIAKKRQVEGYSYSQERGFDVAEKIAENEASGQLGNIGVGLGLMSGIGAPLGNHVGSVIGGAINSSVLKDSGFCSKCGNRISSEDLFCRKCGNKLSANCCSNCGYEFIDDSPFCPKCGNRRN